MAGNIVPVKPGVPTRLSGANWKSAVIYNQDSLNGVWVSSVATVAPGQGMFVGPLGSLQWSSENGNPWACVDTGVLTSVTLSISDDATQVDNPVAVGIAVAAKLLATGVPNVLTLNTIADNVQLGPGLTKFYNISGYASVVIYPTSLSSLTGMKIGVSQYASDPRLSGIGYLYGQSYQTFADSASIRMAVVGAWLLVSDDNADPTLKVTILGSNRPVEKTFDTSFYSSDGDIWNRPFGAMVAGTNYDMTNDNLASIQGLAWASFVGGNNPTAKGRYELLTPDGHITVLCDTNEMITQSIGTGLLATKLVSLPINGYRLRFTCGTAGNFAPTVTFYPSNG